MLVDTVAIAPMTQFRDYDRTGTRRMQVQGARAAMRIDYTFTDDNRRECQGVDIGILGRDMQIHAVRVLWQRGKLDEQTVSGIIGSIQVN